MPFFILRHICIKMFRKFLKLAIVFSFVFIVKGNAQDSKASKLLQSFYTNYSQGDFVNAEQDLIKVLEFKDSLSSQYLIFTYYNLGVIYLQYGRFVQALETFILTENLMALNPQSTISLGDVYTSKSRVYSILKEYDKSIDFLNQALKKYLQLSSNTPSFYEKISVVYLNLGLTYYKKGDYPNALLFLSKSMELADRYSLPDKFLLELNFAKVYMALKQNSKAEKYFLSSIESVKKTHGLKYNRLLDIYIDYGLFLRSVGRSQEALAFHQKALEICKLNYSPKHTFLALTLKHLGDHFYFESDYATALKYYQKSLIAVVDDFNDTSIFSNPTLNTVIFNFRLLDNLKRKSQALLMYSKQQESNEKKFEMLDKSYQTINLALNLIEIIREDYSSLESKLYLAENEKETYLSAIKVAHELFRFTKNPDYVKRMYTISSLSKSRVLQDEINENEVLLKQNTTDSVLLKRNNLRIQISSVKRLIKEEYQKTKPDTVKIEMWKDQLFQLNKSADLVYEDIKKHKSIYTELLGRAEPLDIEKLQNNLGSNETVVEYFLPHGYADGKRLLYAFTVSNDKINFTQVDLDSTFSKNARIIRETMNRKALGKFYDSNNDYFNALAYMYSVLVKPIREEIVGTKIIVVPDEEISFLPFDAFISEKISSSGLESNRYLIYDYSISYSYSSSFVFSSRPKWTGKVVSFLPNYSSSSNFNSSNPDLIGAKNEVNSIEGDFSVMNFTEEMATESNFKKAINTSDIFHLAMHSNTDSVNSNYSYLIFNSANDSLDDGKLFNYEISSSRVLSPLIVLSACNTGTGDLFHGEGVLSLARSFFLAGVSSVVNTLWEVNDESSSIIMKSFYRNLSKGNDKDDAMRLAKLEYLENISPTYSDPYYWSAYQVLGDSTPVHKGINYYLLTLWITLGLLFSYLGVRVIKKKS